MAVEWKNRVVEHPGRVELTPVQGQTNIYDMKRAEGRVDEVGTPINAENLNEMQKILIPDADPNAEYYLAVVGSNGELRKGSYKYSQIADTEEIDIDEEPAKNSTNLVTSGGIYDALSALYPVGIMCRTTVAGNHPNIGTWRLFNIEEVGGSSTTGSTTSSNKAYGQTYYIASGQADIGKGLTNVTISGGQESTVTYNSSTGIAAWSAGGASPNTPVTVAIAYRKMVYIYERKG